MTKSHTNSMESFSFISGVKVPNRFVMAPMTHFSSQEDGTVSEAEIAYYARRNSVGTVITACTYVTPNGKGFPGQFSAATDAMIPGLTQLAKRIKQNGAAAVLQIFHGGRKCPETSVPNGDVVAPSAVHEEGTLIPRPLSSSEIKEIVVAFGETTRRTIEAGFDGVEIHGANGYLLQQFFSPYTNTRTDEWGGTLENRLRFPLSVVEEVKRVVAEKADRPFLIGYRFSPEESEENGITMEDTFALLDALVAKNLDYVHVSTTDFLSAPHRGADKGKSRMEHIVQRVQGKTPVIGVGSIKTADDVTRAFATGISLVALGRSIIVDPDFVVKIADGRASEIDTTLTPADQERLVVPTPLWNAIVQTPGWFPVQTEAISAGKAK